MQDPLIPLNSYLSQPVYPQLIPVSYVGVEAICRIQAENDRLKHRLEQKTIQEYALKQACQLQGNTYWVCLRSGRWVPFTDFAFDYVKFLTFDPFTSQEPLFEIKLSNREPIFLTAEEVLNDRDFLKLLQMRARCKIIPHGSASQMAALLRSLACEKMESVMVPFLSGWTAEGSNWAFSVFPGFRTSAKSAFPVQTCEAPPRVLPCAAKIAVEQLQRDFAIIRNPSLRMTLLLWQHAAFLHTPLDAFGCRVKHALHIDVSGAVAQRCLEKLLCFGDDQVVPLDADPALFKKELVFHKDRITVINEGCTTAGITRKNAEVLRTALHTGSITTVRRAHEDISAPVHTLPVILGREASSLAWQPEMIPLQMSNEDIDRDACAERLDKLVSRTEYWSAFAAFAADGMPDFRQLLQADLFAASVIADEHELSPELANVFGTLLAIRHFLGKFVADLGCPAFDGDEDWQDNFLRTLEESTLQSETLDGLAAIFVASGRQMIRDGRLACCPCGRRETNADPRGTVYYDRETLAMDQNAFTHICQEAQCSPAAAKRDLCEKGYFMGKPINAQSYMSRIRCYNAYGQGKTIAVYKFRRDTFETFGEPPLL